MCQTLPTCSLPMISCPTFFTHSGMSAAEPWSVDSSSITSPTADVLDVGNQFHQRSGAERVARIDYLGFTHFQLLLVIFRFGSIA